MKKYLYFITLILLTVSCNNEHTTRKKTGIVPTLTAREAGGIKKVAAFYGGDCVPSIDKIKGGTKLYFRLEISNSGVLDSSKQITELNISNIALIFYASLEAERTYYDEIQVELTFEDGQKIEKSYSAQKLDLVLKKNEVVSMVIAALQTQNYDALDTILNDKNGIIDYDKKKLITQIKAADPALGNINSFVPYGFIFFKSDQQKDVLRISGTILRDKQNNEFSVDMDPNSTKNEAIFLNYKL